MIDKPAVLWYDTRAVERLRNARVVELVDSLDSGSSVHSGRAGSTPASRTKVNARNRKISGIFLTFQRETIPLKSARKWSIQQNIQQDCSGGLSHERSSSAAAMAFTLFQSLGTETCFSVSPAYPDFEDEMCSFLLKKALTTSFT